MKYSLGGAVAALGLLLAGCNGTSDYSSASIGGQVYQPVPSTTSLNSGTSSTEVVLTAGGSAYSGTDTPGVVNNLGFSCGSVHDYIPGANATDSQGNPVEANVARCPSDAKSITFFLGYPNEQSSWLVLGTVQLPSVSRQGRYQVSTADLQQSPSKVDPTVSALDSYRARNIAALLETLDSDPSTDNVIEIPQMANDMVRYAGSTSNYPAIPSSPFDYVNYYGSSNSFVSAWTPWLNALNSNDSTASYSFPTKSKVVNQLQMSMARMRAGSYSAVALRLSGSYGFLLNQLGKTQDIAFQATTLVYPDGESRGVGIAYYNNGSGTSASDVVAMKDGASMNYVQALNGWDMKQIPNATDLVDLSLNGRVLGSIAYYDDSNSSVASDYATDYPNASYVPVDADKARYTASGFGGVSVDSNNGLYWLTRSGLVAPSWDPTVLQGLATKQDNRFYDIKLMRACMEPDINNTAVTCTDIPNPTLEQGSGGNYAQSIDLDGPSGTADPGFTITKETAKQGFNANGAQLSSTFRVQILDNGDVVTDLDGDCSPVTGTPGNYQDSNGSPEYRIGFVTRTARDSSGNAESFNVALLMTGDPGDSTLSSQLPQYGTQLLGRIDVQDTANTGAPMYRLSDTSFAHQVRAFWADSYAPRVEQTNLGNPSTSDYPNRHLIVSYGGGAVVGHVDTTALSNPGTCSPP